jgi:RND family efflux transporter MFP subunit
VLALLAAALAAAASCDRKENTFVPPPPPPVTVSRPAQQPVTDYLYLTGNTQAVDQVQLDARVEGFLTSIHFKDGDYVKKGDLLFLIEQGTYKAKVQQAEGQLAAAQAQLLRAGQEYDRQLALLKQNATAKSEVERWKAERDAAEANIAEARAGLDLARINLGYTRVTAPFDGRMDRHLVTPGNLVGAGKPTALALIT